MKVKYFYKGNQVKESELPCIPREDDIVSIMQEFFSVESVAWIDEPPNQHVKIMLSTSNKE